MTPRRRVLIAAVLFLTACTSTTQGPGRSTGATEVTTTSTPSSSSPSTPDSSSSPTTPDTSTAAFPPPDLGRVPVDSAIGDPATADLCAAAGLAPFTGLAPDLTASFDAEQYPPGCSITLADVDQAVLTVSVFAAHRRPHPAEGRTRSTASGLPVYRYPFDDSNGSCERDVVAPNVLLVADTLARSESVKPDRRLSCAASDAMADRVAAAAAAGSVDRLPRAAPSLTELDACAVARRAGISSLGTYATARYIERGFAINCELRTDGAFLFLNAALAETARAAPGTPITVAGHHLFRSAARPGFCAYASVQGAAGDGLDEWVTAAATARGTGEPPEQLCDDTAQALALYLTAAGLP